MIDFKSYFHDKYQGGESFIENVILPIFGEDKYEDAYEEDVLENNPELTTMAQNTGVAQILRLGTINIPMNPTDVFDITVNNHVQMKRNRVAVQQLIRRIMSTYSSAFMVFHYNDDDKWDWRFTFCSKQGNNNESTDSKRYTFLLGPNQSCRTAADNFKKLASKRGVIELDDIVKAFDVESLSKEFFEKYKVRYGRFVGHVIGKEYIDKGDGKGEWKEKECLTPSELFYGLNEDEKVVRDYVKKLLGRIVFLHFLQKKGWLGATDEEWTNGPQDFMHQLFENASADQKENFLDEILEPLFTCLDTPLNQRREVFDTKVDGLRSVRVPFLGGLFERTEEDKALSIFPSELFTDLFKFLSEYNFTIDENDPNDAQVGVDPEMLGRIFENLLEDNKDKGAFYTPKEIVQYMCRESLIAYLQTNVTDEPTREALRQFVTTHDVALLGGRGSALAQNVSQCLKDVKICDPAIGSGAFPMGLLNELFLCRGVIEDFSNAADIKRHIIQQNIYGVDIEKGAVEIARLRFWLSLITDADKPDVLPNMDFKIMQGNSLLEQYKGFDLSHIMDTKTEIHAGHQFQMFEEQIDVIRAEVKDTIKRYYSEQNHDVRRSMREGIRQKIQQQIAVQGTNVDISDIKDIAANDQFFLWHTWFSDVFEENGGFDIVIGNPPYIQLQKDGGLLADLYKPCGFKTFDRMGDIYCLFYEHGYNLLRKGGALCYITSNKWMRTGYGEKTRAFIMDCTYPRILIDFIKMKLFDDATVETNILLFSKEEYAEATLCAALVELNKSDLHNINNLIASNLYNNKFNSADFWTLSDAPTGNLKNKIKKAGIPLKEWDLKVNFGIKTGFNDAFIIPTVKKEEILKACKTEEERERTEAIMHHIIRGKDVGVYQNDWAGLWLLYIPWHFPLHTDDSITGASEKAEAEMQKMYPTLFEHLYQYKEQLSSRNKAETGIRYEWYAMQRWGSKYWMHFAEPKIIWKRIGSILRFAYDEDKSMCLDSTCFATGEHVKFLCAIFNSKLGHFMLQDSPKTGTGDLLISVQAIEPIVVPIPSDKQKSDIETLVDRILEAKKLDPQADTSALEAEIDRLVYDLYGLTEDEIRIVEGNI
ncbi:MAG: Eco57I restriction-modification methylase domain-containing protein [Bacteroidaceae bacterium]|nr:Eco57I restriction-modification methylase domain-containing protein [Bacteroidaceae bacterium]